MRNLLRLALLAVTVFAGAGSSAYAQQPAEVPVMLELIGGQSATANYVMVGGQVKLPKNGKDGFLSVRSGPGTQYAEKDRLLKDEYVILLGRQNGWRAVVYPERGTQTLDMESTCHIDNPAPRNAPKKAPYTGPCRTGWVSERLMTVLAD